MDLPLLLVLIGIVVAVLVSETLGILIALVGLVMLIWPRLRSL